MASKGKQVEAVAYIRTSSAANVGADKDSDKRQRAAIGGYAKRAGYQLVDEFNDAAVSGADPIETRPGFGTHFVKSCTRGSVSRDRKRPATSSAGP